MRRIAGDSTTSGGLEGLPRTSLCDAFASASSFGRYTFTAMRLVVLRTASATLPVTIFSTGFLSCVYIAMTSTCSWLAKLTIPRATGSATLTSGRTLMPSGRWCAKPVRYASARSFSSSSICRPSRSIPPTMRDRACITICTRITSASGARSPFTIGKPPWLPSSRPSESALS